VYLKTVYICCPSGGRKTGKCVFCCDVKVWTSENFVFLTFIHQRFPEVKFSNPCLLYFHQSRATTLYRVFHFRGSYIGLQRIYTVRQKKRNHLWINFVIHNIVWHSLVLLLLINIIVEDIYWISGIYANFGTFQCKKCDVGYYYQ